ncbi:MAG: hypothetical protein HC854_16395 [Flavobacterium sp.]|nr:hypothetical protein [Flavobacterium sp.]
MKLIHGLQTLGIVVEEKNRYLDLEVCKFLIRKQGLCEDLAGLGVFTMRSLGIPATSNVVSYWATSKGGHFFNTFFDSNKKPIYFDYGTKEYNEKLRREPSKVLRTTYSKQAGTLASFEDENQYQKAI